METSNLVHLRQYGLAARALAGVSTTAGDAMDTTPAKLRSLSGRKSLRKGYAPSRSYDQVKDAAVARFPELSQLHKDFDTTASTLPKAMASLRWGPMAARKRTAFRKKALARGCPAGTTAIFDELAEIAAKIRVLTKQANSAEAHLRRKYSDDGNDGG